LQKIVEKNRKKEKKIFHKLDKRYKAFSDFQGEDCFQELYVQYPDSKFILTTRPLEDWLKSHMHMMKLYMPCRVKTKSLRNKTYENARNGYFYNTSRIRDFFKDKPEQFLEMRICEGDGWNKLCTFLDKPIPEVDFPWANKTKNQRNQLTR